ncbi:MAG: hypothetical protein IPK33_25660 [Gemmatimonadetes bacterium]|nr:hypothetical protein [Gemmatimonadota bacterium]
MVWYLVLESFGYWQLTVIGACAGCEFLRGRTDWGRMERRGFAKVPAVAAGALPPLVPPPAATTAATTTTAASGDTNPRQTSAVA